MEQEWLLIDMHTHSEFSKINKPSDNARVKKMTAEEYVNILSSYGVKIFSITDHNYFSSKYYDEIDNYINNNSLNMKLINGVELDVYVELSNGKQDFVHMCVYFADGVNRKQLEKKVNSLYKDKNGSELKPNFIDVLNKFYELKTKYIVVPHGDKDRGLFKKHIIDNLNLNEVPEFYKYAMYKIFNAFDVSPSFFGESEQFWATSFCEKTNRFIELTQNMTDEELDNIKSHITDKIKNSDIILTTEEKEIYDYALKYGAYFSYFNFSDWHNNEDYNPSTNNFIFGSIKTAFESFEMSTLDPISRIINTTDKEIEIPNTILGKVQFKISGKEKKVFFSPGLNAIVGKRGSGKSLLLSVIRNLVDKNDSQGALIKYKSLKISDILAQNRGGINISLGSLSSVAFLTQDEIKDIFENPEKAQKTISNYFIDVKDIDITKINSIIEIGEKIVPINDNYKNLTSNILAIKKQNDYNYGVYNQINIADFKSNYNNSIKSLKQAINNLQIIGINSEILEEQLEQLIKIRDEYIKIVDLYNVIIANSNETIISINSKRTSNQVTQRQNMLDIQKSLETIKNNFDIQLNVEKLKYLLSNLKIDNPSVEIYKKGKYLFVTYYEIPENIGDILLEKIFTSITWANSIDDITKYIMGVPNRTLKSTSSNLVSELKKYINTENVFTAKKEFYEIKNRNIDYVSSIKTLEELKKNIEANNIVNLTNVSPGMKSVAYLDMLFDLEETILILDQPEDNIDNDYISNYLVPNIKDKKRIKQLIFVTHNPSVAVYGDAFNYIYAENNDEITYDNFIIEKPEDKEDLIKILEGGRASFSNRNKKFGNVLGEEEYGNM